MLQIRVTAAQFVLKKFEQNGFINKKKSPRRQGGNKRVVIKDAEFEKRLLSNEMMQIMAPMCLQRRVDYINQKFGANVNLCRLKYFYKKNDVSFRVSSRSWKIKEGELAGLNEERRQFAIKLEQIKQNNEEIVSAFLEITRYRVFWKRHDIVYVHCL